jgi:hypothetical protein
MAFWVYVVLDIAFWRGERCGYWSMTMYEGKDMNDGMSCVSKGCFEYYLLLMVMQRASCRILCDHGYVQLILKQSIEDDWEVCNMITWRRFNCWCEFRRVRQT